MSVNKFRCVHIPGMWTLTDINDPKRPGWVLSICKYCGKFVGWRLSHPGRPDDQPITEAARPRGRR